MSVSEKDVDSASVKSNSLKTEAEYDGPPLKYPKSVFFVITNVFFERFCYYGLRTILSLYFVAWLNYSEDTATVAYHGFLVLCYFTPIMGAIMADSWLGKFKTILILSIVYGVGNVFITLASIPNFIPLEAFSWLGLVLIGLGSGGIKPCVYAFGGDQFVVPAQEAQLKKYFSIFYVSVNGGNLLSRLLTPVLREDVHCFDRDDCYSLAYGVQSILIIFSLIIFVAGKPMYKCNNKPGGNIVVEVCRCIGYGIKKRIQNRKEKKEHWLDHAEDKYGKKIVDDVKLALRALSMFLTVPIFWALHDQQGSRWIFQASRMDGNLGFTAVKPDQMQIVNPVTIVIVIPLLETVVYPLCKKINILQKPLTRMYVGGILAGVSFIMSAVVEWFINSSPENSIHMMWLVPQYFVMAMGEILFSVTGLQFAFTQAPLSMKTVMLSGWHVAVAIGNLVVIFIAEAKIFEDQMWEFLLFAGLMFVSMIILFIQALGYEYVSISTEEEVGRMDSGEIDGSSNKKD